MIPTNDKNSEPPKSKQLFIDKLSPSEKNIMEINKHEMNFSKVLIIKKIAQLI